MAVFVTGIGAITCSWANADALWRAAVDGVSGIKDGLGEVSHAAIEESRRRFTNNALFSGVDFPVSRSEQLALLALEQACFSAGWTRFEPSDGFVLATTTGQIPLWDKALTGYLKKVLSQREFIDRFKHQPLGDLLRSIAQKITFTGKQTLITSACAASTQAIALAAMWLEQGMVERCVVGGVDVLCDLTRAGFSCLQLLSKKAAQPFDQDRSGINLSEGAGFVCLERNPRRAPLARLSGFGMTSDGYHMTAPHPEGAGCYRAMRRALETAVVSLPTSIGFTRTGPVLVKTTWRKPPRSGLSFKIVRLL